MAPRSTWKGFVKLSLVSVPVKAFTAHDTSEEIHLNQLHKDCHQRVRYQKVCPEHGVLENKDIVSGYEFAENQYVVIDTGEIDKLRKQSDRSINIAGFVATGEVDPIYHAGKTYYLLPDGVAGNKPYALLHKVMSEEGVAAVAQIVLSGREQLVLLRTLDGLLVMSVLAYPAKVKAQGEFERELDAPDLGKGEVDLTRTLIDASRIADFDIAAFEDEYTKKLTKLIEMKVEGEEIVQTPEPEEPVIINLMEALKKSVAEAQASAAGAQKKMAPSAGKKKATRKRKSG